MDEERKAFCVYFLFLFCSSVNFFEPRDYRVVFVIQKTDTARKAVSVLLLTFNIFNHKGFRFKNIDFTVDWQLRRF